MSLFTETDRPRVAMQDGAAVAGGTGTRTAPVSAAQLDNASVFRSQRGCLLLG